MNCFDCEKMIQSVVDLELLIKKYACTLITGLASALFGFGGVVFAQSSHDSPVIIGRSPGTVMPRTTGTPASLCAAYLDASVASINDPENVFFAIGKSSSSGTCAPPFLQMCTLDITVFRKSTGEIYSSGPEPRELYAECPEGSSLRITDTAPCYCQCNGGDRYSPTAGACITQYSDETCPVSNPIKPGGGTKVEAVVDYVDPRGSFVIRRAYAGEKLYRRWIHQYMHQFESVGSMFVLLRSDGSHPAFGPRPAQDEPAGNREWTPRARGSGDRLIELRDGIRNIGWLFYSNSENLYETYNEYMQQTGVYWPDGRRLTFYFASGPGSALTAVEDHYGRRMRYLRTSSTAPAEIVPPGHVGTDQIGTKTSIRYAYEESASIGESWRRAGQLTSVISPDGFTRRYHYEHPTEMRLLTGATDELSHRIATYEYDEYQRANSSYHFGDNGEIINRYNFNFVSATETAVTAPNGAVSSIKMADIGGYMRVVEQSQPAGSGCDASTQYLGYDANGNVNRRDGFSGQRTCHAHDMSRNLEISRVDGLESSVNCDSVLGEGLQLPVGGRKTSTRWHPDWRLPIRQAEPKKLTTWVYNGQPDPFNSGITAHCAPADAVLPVGTPIVVLCKVVEQATIDEAGAAGFDAQLNGTNSAPPVQVSTWTYNRFGQVLTFDGPRVDVNDGMSYKYYADSDANHTGGDLQMFTNAANQSTQFTRYDKGGRVMRMVDANNMATEIEYTPKGQVKSVTVIPVGAAAGEVTTYGYDELSRLKRTKLPDDTILEFTYDTAHRMRVINDAAGNSVTYKLDSMGSRIGEEVKDSSGTLVRNITRAYDALNRVKSATGAAQ